MRRRTYHLRSLLYHWRSNSAVTLGVAVGSAALIGALVVGDSMRGTLRELALGRIGRTDHALQSGGFFREQLAANIASSDEFAERFSVIAPTIVLSGAVNHAETGARVNRMNVFGVDERFLSLARPERKVFPSFDEWSGRSVVLNDVLAGQLGASTGDDVLLRFARPGDVSPETLLGRRDRITATLRLTVHAVVPAEDIGAFGLSARQPQPANAYVPLAVLQRALDRAEQVNTLLVAANKDAAAIPQVEATTLQSFLRSSIRPADLGLRVRVSTDHAYVALESEAMLIDPIIETAALDAVRSMDLEAAPLLTYLANQIAKAPSPEAASDEDGADASIPYSTVSAIDPALVELAGFTLIAGDLDGGLSSGEILLNAWAAEDLQARPEDRITLTYYVTSEFGTLQTRKATFRLRGVVALSGAAADSGFAPEYRGMTDTQTIADWDPPFPVDLSAIRDKDEDYWDRYRATPKAFIPLQDGQRMWASEDDRFGRITSIRIHVDDNNVSLHETAKRFEQALVERIDLQRVGMRFQPVRARLSTAGEGSTDFGLLFLGFSFFLIAAAAMLVALLFRLGAERRAGEIGLLLATGYTPRRVARLFLEQAAVLAIVGGIVGLIGSLGYAALMLAGLQTWWADAVHTPFLRLYASPTTLTIGFAASILVAMISLGWSIRGLSRLSPRRLLAGAVAAGAQLGHDQKRTKRRTLAFRIALAGFLVACAMLVSPFFAEGISAPVAFFIGGTAMLTGLLAVFMGWLQRDPQHVIRPSGGLAIVRLGIRNARRNAGRSLLTAGLIASAGFVITALQAFRLPADAAVGDPQSPAGGFVLFAESAAPLMYDLNTPAGREALNLHPDEAETLDAATFYPMRLRPGDETSCLNLYLPAQPRILGAPPTFLKRGGFVFTATLAKTEEERQNSWKLLQRPLPDGAIPVIGDENAVRWQLHLDLGKDLVMQDERGRDVRIQFVALLAGSFLQDELIVSETNFNRLFPSLSGYSFFLIEAPPDAAEMLDRTLEASLAAYGFDAGSTAARIAAYQAVQNTYLSTFQALGGFGLILGSIGLGAVLLRNVWERRSELALLSAVGFSRAALGRMVLAENTVLLLAGLFAGVLSAMWAVAPHVAGSRTTIPWFSLALTLLGVLACGILAGLVAVASMMRAPLLPALRAE